MTVNPWDAASVFPTVRGMDGFFRSTMRAASASDAEKRLRELYGDVALGGLGAYRETSAGDARFALSQVLLDGSFEVDADTRVVTIAFSTPGYRWRSGDEDGDLSTAPALFQPGRRMSSRLTGRVGVTTATFDVGALTAHAEATYGERVRLDFDGARAATPDLGRAWTETVQTVLSARLLENDLTRAHAYRALAMMALEAFRLRADRESSSLTARGALTAYRRATTFIDDHLGLPISEADIAAAAGVSVADLRVAFAAQSTAGWTPVRHLRQARLAAVHLDLLDGSTTRGDRVTDIAARWGFTSSEKFNRWYREAFGTTPGSTLAR